MKDDNSIQFDRWLGAAEAYRNTVRRAYQKITQTKNNPNLSSYGLLGPNDKYQYHIPRIDEAIALLEKSKFLFREAERLRNDIPEA